MLKGEKINPLTNGGMFYGADLYGGAWGKMTTATDASPEPSEQAVMASDEQSVQSPKVNQTSIMMWAGILLLFVVLFHMK